MRDRSSNLEPTRTMQQHPLNILLLDDEPAVLFALKLLLQVIGFNVTDFSKPIEAIAALNSAQEFDLILSDLRMPEINGLKVLEEAKKIRPNINFILMSAHANSTEMEKARALGVDGFLPKPVSPDDFKKMVASLPGAAVSAIVNS